MKIFHLPENNILLYNVTKRRSYCTQILQDYKQNDDDKKLDSLLHFPAQWKPNTNSQNSQTSISNCMQVSPDYFEVLTYIAGNSPNGSQRMLGRYAMEAWKLGMVGIARDGALA